VVATLENAAGKQYSDAAVWVVEFREEERRQVVLMIDTSGSMAGEPMALASLLRRCSPSRWCPGISAS
jgi:uncharacterized protein with von Willebrand factor type A (vWA) domain